MRPNEAPMEGAMAVLTTPATEVADDLVTIADGLADASARFVQTARRFLPGATDRALEPHDAPLRGGRSGPTGRTTPCNDTFER